MKSLKDDLHALIERAFAEDLGDFGDITSVSVIPSFATSEGHVVAREPGCIAGIDAAISSFLHIDHSLMTTVFVPDGTVVDAGTVLASVAGSTRSLLAAERVALNFLGHLSGIATMTRTYVDAVSGSATRISDTRKTTPGLRRLEKAAVAAGGGRNHRFGLFDAVLIKDNHIAAAGSITAAVRAARERLGPDVTVEVEVDTLEQLGELLRTTANTVLLDNMDIDSLRSAVVLIDGRMVTEASGGVTLDTVASIASTGVDIISVGRLTHSAPSLDVALDLIRQPSGQFE